MKRTLVILLFFISSCSNYTGVKQYYLGGFLVTEVKIDGGVAWQKMDMTDRIDSAFKANRLSEANEIYKRLR